MRFLALIIVVIYINCVFSKNNVKKLTESMGQEVIELGSPIKDLPPGLEEEPSAENDEETTSTTLQVVTKKETKKTVTTTTASSKSSAKPGKDIDVADTLSQEDEEARIEKELADIYKDNADYKADSVEKEESTNVTTIASTPEVAEDMKPIGRKGGSFVFQPESNNKAAIEKFRTSVDEINCNKVTKKLSLEDQQTNTSSKIVLDMILFGLTLIITKN
ncbi:hypothetical protein K1T71_000794 [Dendrolimus kikuchii]|uniref:Uncharacterized protein n=1 Tax=Dendrolimus kikuchii TaxID=765133 RepID=A0ACC1DKJ8_9NEOP|nr:hypothetical protein K1T71_000794 [Dendrolimus kikuchii]